MSKVLGCFAVQEKFPYSESIVMKLLKTLFWVTLLCIFISAGGSGADITPSSMEREHDPVQVPGELLSRLHGLSLASMRLYAHREGSMAQIPFQFDERLENGDFVFNLGKEAGKQEANGTLDPRDFLVFRISDTGDRAPRDLWPTASGIELELVDPNDRGRSYCYLLHFQEAPPERKEADTVVLEHWDPYKEPDTPFIVKGMSYQVEGMVNKIRGRYYKTAVNESFRVPESAGGAGVNILDGQRMRAFAEVFFGMIRIEADETSMTGGIESLRRGEVRGYGRQWMTVALPLGLYGPRVYSDVFAYDRVIASPMRITIPINPRHIMTRAGIEFGYDLNEKARGMRFYSPNCMQGVTIDGRMTEKERGIPDHWAPWHLITGPQGSLIIRVSVDQSLLDQTENHLTYIDDKDACSPPEDEPGSIGYARTTVVMKSVKPGKYDFRIEWYFPPHFYKNGSFDKEMLREFLDIADNPLLIKVDGRMVENRAVSPPPLMPR